MIGGYGLGMGFLCEEVNYSTDPNAVRVGTSAAPHLRTSAPASVYTTVPTPVPFMGAVFYPNAPHALSRGAYASVCAACQLYVGHPATAL